MSLRVRLLISYLVLLTIALSVITGALMVFLGARQAPPQPTYERLASMARGLNIRDLIAEFQLESNRAFLQVELPELIDNYAESRNVRVLQVRAAKIEQPDAEFIVIYDSADVFANGSQIDLRPDNYKDPRLQPILDRNNLEQAYGSFQDPSSGEDWLVGGFAVPTRSNFFRPGTARNLWLLAELRTSVSLQQILQDFGSALLPPMIQAGIVGLLVAIVLALLISRNIARPLQATAAAASAVADGNFDQKVPISGPPEVREVGEAFNRMSAEVRAAQDAQREFLANVSHDLKTPLTSIQGYSQAIMDGAARNPKEAAEIIHEEAARMNRMVVELTDLVRIQAGRLSMKTSPIDVGQLVAAVGQRLMVVAKRKGVQLQIDAAPMPHIAGDGDRLAQVLTNLISNAVKFTPEGGQVSVRTRVHEMGVELTVQDTGVGIPQKDLSRIFERFYQVDKARGPRRGTGLGLAITQEIIQAHGGRITVNSGGKGKGTTFNIWLPSPQLSTIIRAR